MNPSIAIDFKSLSSTTFVAYDCNDDQFFIRGRIDTYSDYLTFRIATKNVSLGTTSAIDPTDFFDAMMSHFLGQAGGLPSVIHAIWDSRELDYITNLTQFNRALASGADAETAALATFTGRMAANYNYINIVFGLMEPANGPPPYRKVNVYFKK